MEFQRWALPQIAQLLPLDKESLEEIISYTETLPEYEAAEHLRNLLGDSPQALEFITSFNANRPTSSTPGIANRDQKSKMQSQPPPVQSSSDAKVPAFAPPSYAPPGQSSNNANAPAYAPPAHPPPSSSVSAALRRPHTNAVIEAAHVRAKDEVRFKINSTNYPNKAM